MNHVLGQGAGTVEHAWIMGLVTIVFLAVFVGLIWWTYSRRNRARMEQAARLPLEDEP